MAVLQVLAGWGPLNASALKQNVLYPVLGRMSVELKDQFSDEACAVMIGI